MVIVTCFHGRHDIARLWCEHTSKLGLRIFAAITEGDSVIRDMCRHFGVAFIEVPNDPLGAKHNVAIGLAMAQDIYRQCVAFLPSDDFVSARWLADASEAIEGGAHYVMPSACGMYDVATGRACVLTCRSNGSRKFGAGRVISRTALDKVGVLWTHSKGRGLDSDSHARVTAAGFPMHVLETDYLPVTDVKTAGNLWPYDTWKRGTKNATPSEVLWMVSDEHRAQLISSRV